MNTLDAVMTIETGENVDEDTMREAWQYLIDTGIVWQLQGWYGRAARDLIESGYLEEGSDDG